MSTNGNQSRLPIEGDIRYYKPDSNDWPIAVNDLETFLGLKNRVIVRQPIQDCRGREGDFQLDSHGFCFRNHETKLDLRQGNDIQEEYGRELEPLLRKEL